MSYHVRDIDKAWSKLGMTIREKNHKHAMFFHEGKIVITTKRSLGSGKLEGNIPFLIRQQMRLSESEFDALIACPLDLPQYIELLKKKRVIQ